MALIHYVFLSDDTRWTNVIRTKIYSENPAIELTVLGALSLCLTLVNIVCIFLAGVAVYRVKEVAPLEPRDMHWWRSGGKITSRRNSSHGNNDPWDFYRWCNDSERLQLAQESGAVGIRWRNQGSLKNSQNCRPRPNAQEIEDYFRRQTLQYANRIADATDAVFSPKKQVYTTLVPDIPISTNLNNDPKESLNINAPEDNSKQPVSIENENSSDISNDSLQRTLDCLRPEFNFKTTLIADPNISSKNKLNDTNNDNTVMNNNVMFDPTLNFYKLSEISNNTKNYINDNTFDKLNLTAADGMGYETKSFDV